MKLLIRHTLADCTKISDVLSESKTTAGPVELLNRPFCSVIIILASCFSPNSSLLSLHLLVGKLVAR